MTPPPTRPKIYHITHVRNLAAIVGEGCLVSDATMIERGGPQQAIGMAKIKHRRVEELEVTCHPGTNVGDYVPFYFCPRSVMLYVIYCRNHPGLTYCDGQGPIVHLEADLHEAVRWAQEHGLPWCFSLSNAGARYAEFRCRLEELNEIDWNAVGANDFSATEIKERKQAEFLLHERFPFAIVERIGVHSETMRVKVNEVLDDSEFRPAVEVRPLWYFPGEARR